MIDNQILYKTLCHYDDCLLYTKPTEKLNQTQQKQATQ